MHPLSSTQKIKQSQWQFLSMSLLWHEGRGRQGAATDTQLYVVFFGGGEPVEHELQTFGLYLLAQPVNSLILPYPLWSRHLHPVVQKPDEYLLNSQTINYSFSFKLDLSDFSILFHVWMSNFRTRRLVKSELPHSGFLAFTQKEKPIVANCLCDSLVAGTDEKIFLLKDSLKILHHYGRK